MGMMEQQPDGSWAPATPLGWQGSGIDWEVYSPRGARKLWRAEAYDEDVLVVVVEARTRLGLALKMRRARRRAGP